MCTSRVCVLLFIVNSMFKIETVRIFLIMICPIYKKKQKTVRHSNFIHFRYNYLIYFDIVKNAISKMKISMKLSNSNIVS